MVDEAKIQAMATDIPDLCTLIIAHPIDATLLVTVQGDGWALPIVELAPQGSSRWRSVSKATDELKRRFGLEATVLRCVSYLQDAVTGRMCVGFVAELQVLPVALPPTLSWLPRVEYERQRTNHAGAQASDWWTSLEQEDDPGSLLPWERIGWYAAAVAWIDANLARHDIGRTGSVEQERSWFLSCVLRIPTSVGSFFFKASCPLYPFEARLTQRLSRDEPAWMPEVIASDGERGWLLMRGSQGTKLIEHPSKHLYEARWQELVRNIARLQQSYVAGADALWSLGCPDISLPALREGLEELFSDLSAPAHVAQDAVSPQELADLRRLAPRLDAIFLALAEHRLSDTLCHGDLHSGNVIAGAEGSPCTLIDWAGFVGVGQPFMCLSVIFGELWDPNVRARVLDAYLSCWTDHEPMDRLREAAHLAVRVGALLGAIGHARQLAFARTPWEREQERGNLRDCLMELRKLLSDPVSVGEP